MFWLKWVPPWIFHDHVSIRYQTKGIQRVSCTYVLTGLERILLAGVHYMILYKYIPLSMIANYLIMII